MPQPSHTVPDVAESDMLDVVTTCRYEMQLRDMRQMLVWRQMLEQQHEQTAGHGAAPARISSGRDKTAPHWRFVYILEKLVAVAAGGRVLCIVCRSRYNPKAEVTPVPVFWVGQSRHGHVLGLLSSAKFG